MSSASAWDGVFETQLSEGKADIFDSVASFVRDAFAARRADVSAKKPRNMCCARIGDVSF